MGRAAARGLRSPRPYWRDRVVEAAFRWKLVERRPSLARPFATPRFTIRAGLLSGCGASRFLNRKDCVKVMQPPQCEEQARKHQRVDS